MTVLSQAAARAVAATGGEYCSKLTVTAERLDAPHQWTTTSDSSMEGQVGDWLVSDGRSQWTVSARAFDETYEATSDGRWRKTRSVRAAQLEESCDVETGEGIAHAEPGDWIVTDRTGNAWPVSADEFARRYEERGRPTGAAVAGR